MPSTGSGPAKPSSGAKRKRPTQGTSAQKDESARNAGASRTAAKSRGRQREPEDEEDDDPTSGEDKRDFLSPELLRRILHECFEDKSTRMTKDANVGFAKYLDAFVREAIRRSASGSGTGFLEVSCDPNGASEQSLSPPSSSLRCLSWGLVLQVPTRMGIICIHQVYTMVPDAFAAPPALQLDASGSPSTADGPLD